MGGCSSHYGGAHVRGSRDDYDYWRRLGNKGWAYDDVLPYFAKMGDLQIDRLKTQKHHGVGGPMQIVEANRCPLTNALIDAVKNRGYKWRDDINGVGDMEGTYKSVFSEFFWKSTLCKLFVRIRCRASGEWRWYSTKYGVQVFATSHETKKFACRGACSCN